jgi:transcriptional regulator with XRE-family HTH domain
MPTLAVHIGHHLRAARKKAGLSQADAAEEIGMNQPSVYGWESGASIPTVRKAFALADLYGVGLDELLGYPLPQPPKGS